jgi:predicted deacylase
MSVELGTATAATGDRATGWLHATALPTGGTERLPVVIINGGPGPTAWVTAGVHGNEVVGLAVAQDLAADLTPADVTGTVVIVPSCNPAGLRRRDRESYYDGEDPNRGFPDLHDDRAEPPSVQELIDKRLYKAFTETVPADALLDLHTAGAGTVPFTIRDRVLYDADRGARTEDDARVLAGEMAALADAIELPVVTEYLPATYTDKSLQRSLAGAALNAGGIPALTLELGEHRHVRRDRHAAGLAATYRGLVAIGCLDTVPTAVADADPGVEAPVKFPVRRFEGPRTTTAGVVRHRVTPGDTVAIGETVADVVTPHGVSRETIESDHDGYVLGHREGALAYENDPVCHMAVRDTGELVAPRDGD